MSAGSGLVKWSGSARDRVLKAQLDGVQSLPAERSQGVGAPPRATSGARS